MSNLILENLSIIMIWMLPATVFYFMILFLGSITVPILLRDRCSSDPALFFLVGLASLGLITLTITFLALYFTAVALVVGYIGIAMLLLGLLHLVTGGLASIRHSSLWLYLSSYFVLMVFQFSFVQDFGVDTPANNFLLNLPIDYRISLMFAESMQSGELLAFGDWLGSDRPPLMSGFILLFQVPTLTLEDSYLFVGTLVQLLIVPTVLSILRLMTPKSIDGYPIGAVIVFLMTLSPLFIHNVSFLWPKILSATFLLGAIYFMFFEVSSRWSFAALSGVLLCLSYLSHGGSAYAIIGLGLLYLIRNFSLRGLLFSSINLLAFILPYIPWVFYQKIVQPPGDRLLKWQLLDHIPVTDRSFVDIASEKYDGFRLVDLLARLGISIETQLISPYSALFFSNDGTPFGERFVSTSFFATTGAIGPATLPILLLLSIAVWDRKIQVGILIWAACAAGWFLIPFKGALYVHEGPYILQLLPWLLIAYGVQYLADWKRVSVAAALAVQGTIMLWLFWDVRAQRVQEFASMTGTLASVSGDIGGSDYAKTMRSGSRIIGTWAEGGDSDTATVRIVILNADRVMYRTGADASGQLLQIDSDAGLLLSMEAQVHEEWTNIGFDLSERVTVTLIDTGTKWGQWSAVAVPD